MIPIPKHQQSDIHLDELNWIIGSWYGGNNTEKMEEHWFPRLGDALSGWFRWKKENSIFLYEFMLFQQVDKATKLKIKHFDANLVGWEEKDKWVEYEAWESRPNKILLKAADPSHSSWISYEKIDERLTATFYDASGKKIDSFVFHN
jgi:hypothetical protein